MRRGIRSVEGSTIKRIARTRCKCKPISIKPSMGTIQKRIRNQKIESVQRLGKRIILRLSSSDSLVIEPRMTGLVLVTDPPNRTHLRLRLELSGTKVDQLLFWDRRGLGTLTLYNPEQFESELKSKLGIDALKISLKALMNSLSSSVREIKPALLDQTAIAGVGNLYASELLFISGINPQARCCDLSEADWSELRTAMRDVLKEAIRYEGSTLADGTYRNALNESGGYQNHHRVYARAGEKCKRCRKTRIKRIVQTQRATFFCPRCQK